MVLGSDNRVCLPEECGNISGESLRLNRLRGFARISHFLLANVRPFMKYSLYEVSCIIVFYLFLFQRVQAAIPPPQQHLMATEQSVLTVKMTPQRAVTNTPLHENTQNHWRQGQTNHHSKTQLTNHYNSTEQHDTIQQQTNHHSAAQTPKRTHRDYIFGKVIGEGSFSTVYLAKDIHNNKECASKSTFTGYSLSTNR
jgi:hypothetical protein